LHIKEGSVMFSLFTFILVILSLLFFFLKEHIVFSSNVDP